MVRGFNERTWLAWLVKVRILIITFLLAIELAITTLTPTNVNRRLYMTAILLWYGVSILHVLVLNARREVGMQSRSQILTDLAFATVIIYVTGGIDTSFNFLYPLIIIVASILISDWWAYITAALSFILFGAVLELTYFELIPSYASSRPDPKSLQAVILINLFAYITIAYLSGRLSNRLRQVDVELADKSDALEDLQALHENIVDSISGGLITTNLQNQIKLVNPAGLSLLEREQSDLAGKRVDDLFLDPLPPFGAPAVHTEVRSFTPSGQEKTLGVTVSALDVPGRGNIGYVYTFDDLTEIRRLEREVRLRDRLAAIGRLAAGIAHEIRNPLSSIAGSVKVLSNISALTDDQRDLVAIVTRESERLNAIITDFLAYSREKTYQVRPVDLVELLGDTLALLEHRPELRVGGAGPKINIVRNFAVSNAISQGDGDKLKQVFWNICENAIRAMCADAAHAQELGLQPRVYTLTVGVSMEAGEWHVSIADTGPGMPTQQIEKIFEPFQTTFAGGTGLGLAIVYQIVQAHEATISVDSEPGHGTNFTLRFRRVEEAAGEIASAAANASTHS